MRWLKDRDDREFEAHERRERFLESLPPQEYTAYFAGLNTKALLAELRFIRWLLLFILIMLITFAVHTLPRGWWYQPWWSA